MGVPRFFIDILKKYKTTHFKHTSDFKFQYFFMDYNAFIYPSVAKFFKETTYESFQKLSVNKREQAISDFIVDRTIDYVNELKPEKMLYIAFDGPAPRSKMKLQRDRRYKGLKAELFFDELRDVFEIEEKNTASLWDKASLSPGTSMMQKIAKGLVEATNKKKFMKGKIIVIVDDTNIPGEGEHKILNFIRTLKNLDDKVLVYSPDADMIILSLQYEGDIYNIRKKDPMRTEDVELYPDEDVKYIIFSVTKYREALKKEIGDYDEIRLSRDVIFLTFFIGNDFVKPIYFTKSNKNGSFWTILGIYKRLLKKYQNTSHPYLVFIKNESGSEGSDEVEQIPLVNQNFLIDIFQELANMEDKKMKEYYSRLLNDMERKVDEPEDTFEGRKASFEHDKYYKSTNPFAEPELFKLIDYSKSKNVWIQQYYSYFFDITPDNPREFRNYKRLICRKYLESLSYCLRYYLTALPSWDWYYPFRVAPIPSDILYFMDEMPKELNFQFEMGKPYYPIEQLSMIVPPQSIAILPRPLRLLITTPTSPLAPYYPIDFQLDKLAGEKFVYSHALLPAFVDEIARPAIQNTFSKFTKAEQERNKLKDEYTLYEPDKISVNNITLNAPRKMV